MMTPLKISIVTPSYNSGIFLRRTIESILAQNYANLEYILQDGGSTDETSAILSEYRSVVAHCTSAPDRGQYDALNKGFEIATGEVMAWLNADDIYLQGTLPLIGKIFEQFPQIKWLTTRYPLAIDENDILISTSVIPGFSMHGFLCGDNLPAMGWEGTAFIQQESTFWRRSLWVQAGGYIDSDLQFAADFDLWARFFKQEELYAIDVPLACFRKHASQKTSTNFKRYLDEAGVVFTRIGGRVPGPALQALRLRLATKQWIASGRFEWQKKLFKPSKQVVYDWAKDIWNIKEY
jgi:glycosyltransferase involved in cell wall biosynthesis